MHGAAAFINQKYQEKTDSNSQGLFIIQPHPTTGYCLDEKDIRKTIKCPCLVIKGQMGYDSLTIKRLLSSFFNIRRFKKVHKSLLLITPASSFVYYQLAVFIDLGLRYDSVVIDEGVSGYLSPYGWARHNLAETRSIFSAFIMALRRYMSLIVSRTMGIRSQNCMLYQEKDGYLVLNKSIADSYLCTFNLNKQDSPISVPQKYLLFLSQPFNDAKYFELISRIALIANNRGYVLCVKLHPRDNRSLWENVKGVMIIDADGPIEEVFYRFDHRPKVVIGLTSTALLTLHAFFRIDCATIIPIYNKLSKRNSNYDEKFFIEKFQKEVFLVNDYYRLESIL